jgi:type IV secretory pathway VirB10-like protein
VEQTDDGHLVKTTTLISTHVVHDNSPPEPSTPEGFGREDSTPVTIVETSPVEELQQEVLESPEVEEEEEEELAQAPSPILEEPEPEEAGSRPLSTDSVVEVSHAASSPAREEEAAKPSEERSPSLPTAGHRHFDDEAGGVGGGYEAGAEDTETDTAAAAQGGSASEE